MVANLCIHIGYHKTATTWMQNKLFLPDHGYHPIANHAEVSKYITSPHGLEFNSKYMKGLIQDRIKEISNDQVPIISSELLCGNPFLGGRESDIFADRIHEISPKAKILITIRSQKGIIKSTYMQYLSRGGRMTLEQFFAGAPDLGYYGFNSAHFEYDKLILRYQKGFGIDNVFVTTQENLSQHPQKTCETIARFCNNNKFSTISKENLRRSVVSYPESATPFLRRINHVRKSTLNLNPVLQLSNRSGGDFLFRSVGYIFQNFLPARLIRSYHPVTSYVEKEFMGRYKDSNSQLGCILPYDLDLSKYE